ncbi:FACT complex subunit [Aphelenchoides bicaudatus]|nr:FACT complex subunit [Aphelenchoides bicaudatus]
MFKLLGLKPIGIYDKMGSIKIDRTAFINRATRIYELWNSGEDETLSNLDALCFMVGENGNDYSKSQSLQTWLFNCNLLDTLFVMTKTGMYFLGSGKKAQYFQSLDTKENLHPGIPPFTVLSRDKTNKDQLNFEQLLTVIKEAGGKYGCFTKEQSTTEFGKSWDAIIKEAGMIEVDVAQSFALLFAVKDEKEVNLMKKSAEATVTAWNFLRKKIIEIVDKEKKIRHSRVAEELEKSMVSTTVQGRLAQDNLLEVCYTPIIQSGKDCKLKFSVENTDKHVHYGSIVSTLGARYLSYCANVGRTMMVEPSKDMEDIYEFLLNLENFLLENLKPGTMICEVHKLAVDFIKEKKPDLLKYITTANFGFGTGIEFREALLLINDKCKQIIKPNMTFVLNLGAQNFPNPTASDSDYKVASIFLSDTVLVAEQGPCEVLTLQAKNRCRTNSIRFRNNPEEQTRDEENVNDQGRTKRSVVLQEQTRHKQTNEDKRKDHQRELATALNESAKARLADLPGAENVQRLKKSNISYKTQEKFPNDSEVNECKIFVDKKYDTIILPIFGMPVPFHISHIKNTSIDNDGDYTYLRINFTHPGSQIGKDSALFTNPVADFVKEMTFRSSNTKEPGEMHSPSLNLQTAFRLIKELQKRFRTMEAEQREKEGAVKQDKLVVSNSKGNPKLKEIYVRPNIISKRIMGYLEAHVNGFRYTTLRGDKIDVLYNNIKHAFFQPCDNEMLILLHFNLKNPVLWGKKKYNDIQFYTEVGEVTTDLNKYHNTRDGDDIASEQMEREMRKKLNSMFQSFCDKVARATNEQVDFETPFNELGFTGVPFRSTVTLKPTSTCLVSLTEMPTLIISLDEIELVHFERVTGNTRSFDLVIVFKDYQRKTHQISHIPAQSLDSVKDWLNSCDIRYSEGPMSLNWNNIMKTIVQDPEAFFADGGWDFLVSRSDDENEDEEESEESEFEPSGAEDSSEASDEEDSNESDLTEDSESEASLGSDESSGKDWSDLEEEAAKADRAKEHDDVDTNRKRKGGSSKAPPMKKRR